MTNILQKIERKYLIAFGLICLCTLLSFQNLAFYIRFDFRLYAALMIVPFVLYVKDKNSISLRYGLVSFLLLAMYPFLKIMSCFFLGYAFLLLFIIEVLIGRLNNLPLILLLIISPISIYLFELIGFPLRLMLTDLSTHMLSLFNHEVSSRGNIIFIGDMEFGVDKECTGLKMVITSLLISLGMIAFFEKKTKTYLNLLVSIGLLSIACLLILACNLARIVAIVLLNARPETLSHDMIGIGSIIVCVILPMYYLIAFTFKLFSREMILSKKPVSRNKSHIFMIMLLASMIGILNFHREKLRNTGNELDVKQINLKGYGKKLLENGVIKLENHTTMVYVKPISNFYGADHTPLICWKGSGYKFTKEELVKIGEYEVYFAELHSETGRLFTVWWYDNGLFKTVNQFEWRWRMAKGEGAFRIINVTSSDKSKLLAESYKILKSNL